MLRAIADLPGVSGTSSLFDAKNLKNIDDTIHVKPYLENLPVTPAEVAEVRADAIRNPLVLGNLISADGQTLALNVYLKDSGGDANFDREITAAIEALVAPLREHIAEVYQVGVAAMRSDLTGKIRADQRVFLPLSVLVLLLTLAFSLRRATAVVMPLATAGVSVLWTLGFMGWHGHPGQHHDLDRAGAGDHHRLDRGHPPARRVRGRGARTAWTGRRRSAAWPTTWAWRCC